MLFPQRTGNQLAVVLPRGGRGSIGCTAVVCGMGFSVSVSLMSWFLGVGLPSRHCAWFVFIDLWTAFGKCQHFVSGDVGSWVGCFFP